MAEFKITIKGLNRVANNLRRAAADMPGTVSRAAAPWGQKTRATLKATKYPPKLKDQKYRRTGRLANSWSSKPIRNPAGVEIANSARNRGRHYSRYVVGDAKGEGQAAIHGGGEWRGKTYKKRWWKAKDVIDKEIPKLTKALSKALRKDMTR